MIHQCLLGNPVSPTVLSKKTAIETNHKFHKHAVIIVRKLRRQISIYISSGILISKDLVLTCASTFFLNNKKLINKCFQIYNQEDGDLINPYDVQAYYIPPQYQRRLRNNQSPQIKYSFALVKLSKKIETANFVELRSDIKLSDIDKNDEVCIIGYPQSCYKGSGPLSPFYRAHQASLICQRQIITTICNQKGILQLIIQSPKGFSGSPILLIKNQAIYLIGLHLESSEKEMKAKNQDLLITLEMLKMLESQILNLWGSAFNVFKKERQMSALEITESSFKQKIQKRLARKQTIQRKLNFLSLQSNTFQSKIKAALFFQQLDDIKKGISLLQKIKQKDKTKNIRKCTVLGRLYAKNKQFEKALKCYRYLTNTGSINEQNAHILLYLYICTIQAQEKILQYKKKLKQDKSNPQIYQELGDFYQQIFCLSAAKRCLKKAFKLNPNNKFNIALKLSQILLEGDEIQQCLKYINVCQQSQTKNPKAAYILGGLCEKINTQLAIKWYKIAIELDPFSPYTILSRISLEAMK